MENDFPVMHDLRIRSAYKLSNGTKIWIIEKQGKEVVVAVGLEPTTSRM
jgi:hypothetical protein